MEEPPIIPDRPARQWVTEKLGPLIQNIRSGARVGTVALTIIVGSNAAIHFGEAHQAAVDQQSVDSASPAFETMQTVANTKNDGLKYDVGATAIAGLLTYYVFRKKPLPGPKLDEPE